MRRVLAVLLASALLVACGKKGDLYLPLPEARAAAAGGMRVQPPGGPAFPDRPQVTDRTNAPDPLRMRTSGDSS